jgi:hypothetical protein
MQIKDVFYEKTPDPFSTEKAKYIVFDGEITRDQDEKMFRLYPSPSSRSVYFVIPMDGVGEIREWTIEEKTSQGIVGASRFRVSVRNDMEIQAVRITNTRAELAFPKPVAIKGSTIKGTAGNECNYDAECHKLYGTSAPCIEKGSDGSYYCTQCCIAQKTLRPTVS